MLKRFTDSEIIEAFRSGGKARERAWEYIFRNWGGKITGSFGSKNAGEVREALDEAAISFEMMVRRLDFEVRSSLFSYFRKCVYNQWLAMRKKETKANTDELDENFARDFAESIEGEIIHAELKAEIIKSLDLVDPRCKTILLLFFNKYDMKEIAGEMGFHSAQVAKNEKMKCWNRYEKALGENPRIRQYLKEIMEHLK